MITFVTPVSPSHLEHVERAAASVRAQTVPCQHVIVVDHDRLGPGNARNVGLMQVQTPFVSFLDADDAVMPTFAQETLAAWNGRYLYTDWYEGNVIIPAPTCAWVTKKRPVHLITAVIPTAWALEVGGFDTSLPGGEDTDFFLKLLEHGYCGQRVARPLFDYGRGGERSQRFINSPEFEKWKTAIFERHVVTMACCGQGDERMTPISPDETYVLVIVTERAYGGTQRRRGFATGTVYDDRVGIGETLWMHPADADHPSGHYQRVQHAPPVNPDEDSLRAMAEIMGTPVPRMPVPPASKPDVSKIIDLWGVPEPEPVVIPTTVDERLKMVEEEHLTEEEIEALRDGHEVNLNANGTATIKRNSGGRPRKGSTRKSAK